MDVEKNLKAYFGEKIREMEEAEDITDLLFDETMISLFSDKSVSFYTDIFSWIHVLYFDSHKKPEIRSKCMHLIAKLETYVHLVPDEALQKALEKVFFLEPWRFSSTEQKKLITSYSGWDKQFLNRLWSRYGSDHVHEFLQMLESMKIKELLPEVLITINLKGSASFDGMDWIMRRSCSVLTTSVLYRLPSFGDFSFSC